jgi:hypothetical protein
MEVFAVQARIRAEAVEVVDSLGEDAALIVNLKD